MENIHHHIKEIKHRHPIIVAVIGIALRLIVLMIAHYVTLAFFQMLLFVLGGCCVGLNAFALALHWLSRTSHV